MAMGRHRCSEAILTWTCNTCSICCKDFCQWKLL